MTKKKVLSVGQCGVDHAGISRALRSFGAEVVAVEDAHQAVDRLRAGGFDLVLVNRIFDADGDSGVDLIRRLRSDAALAQVPVMLVSNYADAQAQAVAAGALPGFGKADLGRSAMVERVAAVLGNNAESKS